MGARRASGLIGAAALLALAAGPAAGKAGYTKGVANAALVAAAKATTLRAIDYDQDLCRNDRTVAQWLAELTAGQAKAVEWMGGPCVLTNDLNPLDSGSDWCARASVILKHPKTKNDSPTIEVYFEKPVRGRVKPAYAFRGEMLAADGEDYSRFRRDFEYDWVSRFPASKSVTECPEDEAQ
jgi:hypothetical protein